MVVRLTVVGARAFLSIKNAPRVPLLLFTFFRFQSPDKKSSINGESDLDSGHGGSEFDAIMLPATQRDKTNKSKTTLPRWNSDLTASSLHKARQWSRASGRLTRTFSAEQPMSKKALRREVDQKKERSKSPTLAHMKLSESGSRRTSLDRLSVSSVNIPASPMLRKSNLSKGYR